MEMHVNDSTALRMIFMGDIPLYKSVVPVLAQKTYSPSAGLSGLI
jgi:hypothetical protein